MCYRLECLDGSVFYFLVDSWEDAIRRSEELFDGSVFDVEKHLSLISGLQVKPDYDFRKR